MTSRLYLVQDLRSPSLFAYPSPGGHRAPVLPSIALRVQSSARVRTLSLPQGRSPIAGVDSTCGMQWSRWLMLASGGQEGWVDGTKVTMTT